MDWAALGEVVKVLGAAATAGAAWFGASIAYRGLSKWRDESIGKRKTELAEQVLVAAYEVRDVFVWVRSRGILGGEGSSRTPANGESKTQQERRNIYFVPIERLTHEKELFAKLQSLRYSFAAHFGDEAIRPICEIMSIHNEIMSSASILIQITHDEDDERSIRRDAEPLLNIVGWGPRDRPDEIDQRMENAILDLEAICRPVLGVVAR